MKILGSVNAINLEKEIAKFEATEQGTDCAFYDLPEKAQEIALEWIDFAINEEVGVKANYLNRQLSRNDDFLRAIGSTDENIYPQEIDACQRFLKFKLEQGVLS